jgi:hypothetical protein
MLGGLNREGMNVSAIDGLMNLADPSGYSPVDKGRQYIILSISWLIYCIDETRGTETSECVSAPLIPAITGRNHVAATPVPPVFIRTRTV